MSTRILIAEDDYIQSTVLEIGLKELGHQIVSVCRSAEEVFNEVVEKRPDLILTDISLEGDMNGIQVMNKIRNSFDTPVIFITGHLSSVIRDQAIAVSNSSLLKKPFAKDQLERAINSLSNISV